MVTVVRAPPLLLWWCTLLLLLADVGEGRLLLYGPDAGLGLPRRRVCLDPAGWWPVGDLVMSLHQLACVAKLRLAAVNATVAESLQDLLRGDLSVLVIEQTLVAEHVDKFIRNL